MAATDEAVMSMIEGEVFGTRPIDELLALVDSTPDPSIELEDRVGSGAKLGSTDRADCRDDCGLTRSSGVPNGTRGERVFWAFSKFSECR
jgi:hypothetical protein